LLNFLLFVVLLVVLLAGYFGWKKFQLKRRNDQKRSALKILKNLLVSNHLANFNQTLPE
jgi:predicted negative regulator of RcsB-dependent stress response